MQYATSFNALHLILAQMGGAPVGSQLGLQSRPSSRCSVASSSGDTACSRS